jgi:hypothetical protein
VTPTRDKNPQAHTPTPHPPLPRDPLSTRESPAVEQTTRYKAYSNRPRGVFQPASMDAPGPELDSLCEPATAAYAGWRPLLATLPR